MRTTDDAEPPLGHLGDIALCPTVAAAQGAKAGHGTWAELELLTVHGILHLLGYDHAEPAEKAEMWDVQGRLLEAWRAPGTGWWTPDGSLRTGVTFQ